MFFLIFLSNHTYNILSFSFSSQFSDFKTFITAHVHVPTIEQLNSKYESLTWNWSRFIWLHRVSSYLMNDTNTGYLLRHAAGTCFKITIQVIFIKSYILVTPEKCDHNFVYLERYY